jgi:hypothetical protein
MYAGGEDQRREAEKGHSGGAASKSFREGVTPLQPGKARGQMKNQRPALLTISHPTNNYDADYVRIRVTDAVTGLVLSDVEVGTLDFAHALFGKSFRTCQVNVQECRIVS